MVSWVLARELSVVSREETLSESFSEKMRTRSRLPSSSLILNSVRSWRGGGGWREGIPVGDSRSPVGDCSRGVRGEKGGAGGGGLGREVCEGRKKDLRESHTPALMEARKEKISRDKDDCDGKGESARGAAREKNGKRNSARSVIIHTAAPRSIAISTHERAQQPRR